MMLKGASIITTLIFSYWLFEFKVQSRHLLGCGLAVLGLIIVGLAEIALADHRISTEVHILHMKTEGTTVGYILMLVSLIFNGFLYAY